MLPTGGGQDQSDLSGRDIPQRCQRHAGRVQSGRCNARLPGSSRERTGEYKHQPGLFDLVHRSASGARLSSVAKSHSAASIMPASSAMGTFPQAREQFRPAMIQRADAGIVSPVHCYDRPPQFDFRCHATSLVTAIQKCPRVRPRHGFLAVIRVSLLPRRCPISDVGAVAFENACSSRLFLV